MDEALESSLTAIKTNHKTSKHCITKAVSAYYRLLPPVIVAFYAGLQHVLFSPVGIASIIYTFASAQNRQISATMFGVLFSVRNTSVSLLAAVFLLITPGAGRKSCGHWLQRVIIKVALVSSMLGCRGAAAWVLQ